MKISKSGEREHYPYLNAGNFHFGIFPTLCLCCYIFVYAVEDDFQTHIPSVFLSNSRLKKPY